MQGEALTTRPAPQTPHSGTPGTGPSTAQRAGARPMDDALEIGRHHTYFGAESSMVSPDLPDLKINGVRFQSENEGLGISCDSLAVGPGMFRHIVLYGGCSPR